MEEVTAHRLALAALRLHLIGDRDATRQLLEGLTAEELREVLAVQTANVAVALPPWLHWAGVAAIGARFGTPVAETADLYLFLRILRMAEEEFADAE